ncbi:hypothetical protein ACN6K6_001343 [Streptomyces violaceoruber]|uniref:hypothetical protein n=1 Tax=Streptomyces violaceoruber group TaxID=2867121 RepID=UPI002E30077F|nr:hypothetical protein [Streptomyces anthocyanicus]
MTGAQQHSQATHLAWATERDFETLRDTLANLSAPHVGPPQSLNLISYQTPVPVSHHGDSTASQLEEILQQVKAVALIFSSGKKRGTDVVNLLDLALENGIGVDIFYPAGSPRVTEKFMQNKKRASKAPLIAQEYRPGDLAFLLQSWIDKELNQAASAHERVALDYKGKRWMDAFGGFQ